MTLCITAKKILRWLNNFALYFLKYIKLLAENVLAK